MPERTRAAGILAIVLALIAYAYAPLLAAGFLGEDLAVLASLHGLEWTSEPSAWYAVQGTDARPGAALSLLASRSTWTAAGVWGGGEALVLRLENLALLCLAGWGLVGFLRRALEPWAGPEVARASGHAGAGLVMVHPLLVSAVARLSMRGDLIAIALMAWSAHAFLAGRQTRRRHLVTLAWVLAAAAGFFSRLALFLPPVLTAFEYQSARRLRPTAVRLRTATTTLVAFAAGVLLESLGRLTFGPEGTRSLLPTPPAVRPELWLERLGVLLMPGNVRGLGATAPFLAALASLIALHPAIVAARSAPRLWGRVILGWGLALSAAIALNDDVRVTLLGLGGAQVLLPAAVVMAIGLGTCSTALSGWRRTCVPIVVGSLFAILGRALAVPHAEATLAVQALREELLDAARSRGWNGTLLVLDPPAGSDGLDPLAEHLPALLSPAFPPGERAARVRVLSLTSLQFEVWSRGDGLSDLRAAGASVLVEARLAEREGEGRLSIPLLSRGDEADRLTWFGEGDSTSGTVLDPLLARHLVVTALPDADTSVPPVVRWSSDAPAGAGAEVTGVWLRGDGAPDAVFDLERRLAWLLGGRVRSTWLAGDLTSITSARITPAPPGLAGVEPHPVGDDWTFDLTGVSLPEPLGGRAEWRLGLFERKTLEYVELEGHEESPGRLRFLGAEAWVLERRKAEQDVVWYLDHRVDGVTVARAEKKRPAGPTRPEGE